MTNAQTTGPWFVVLYFNGSHNRETLQRSDKPLDFPAYNFNTEPGLAQAEADRRNAAMADGSLQYAA